MGKETGEANANADGGQIPYAAFGRDGLVVSLHRRIADSLADDAARIESSLVVGVLGEWGSGKSTVLEGLAQRFATEVGATSPVTLPVRFNPWRYEAEQHLIVPLLKTAQAQVRRYLAEQRTLDDKLKESIRDGAVRLGQTAVALAAALKFKVSVPFLGEAQVDLDRALKREAEYLKPDAPGDDFYSLYFDLHEQIEMLTGRADGSGHRLNLVFLVDDLDRCLPEKAVQVMESVKLFLDVRGCAFVLALDEEVVERGIEHRYKDYLFIQRQLDAVENNAESGNKGARSGGQRAALPITGAEYLEKIIQLPIHLPRPTPAEISAFLYERFGGLFEPIGESGETDDFLEADSGARRGRRDGEAGRPKVDLLYQLLLDALPPNPRKLVRACTLIEFVENLAEARGFRLVYGEAGAGELDRLTLARLLLLQLFAPGLYRYCRRAEVALYTLDVYRKKYREHWRTDSFLHAETRRNDALLQKYRDWLNESGDSESRPKQSGIDATTAERDLVVLGELLACVAHRGEFDPRMLVVDDYPSATDTSVYIALIEDRDARESTSAVTESAAVPPRATPEPTDRGIPTKSAAEGAEGKKRSGADRRRQRGRIEDPERIVEQLASARPDAWENALQDLDGEVLPDDIVDRLLERLEGMPDDDWWQRVGPLLVDAQRARFRDGKFQSAFDEARSRIENLATTDFAPDYAPAADEIAANAAAGRLLAWLGDDRKGIGVIDGLPVIDWVDIPAPNIAYRLDMEGGGASGECLLDANGEHRIDYPYRVARYPVTWAQFQAFVDDPDGAAEPRWWDGLGAGDEDRASLPARWPLSNHPRDNVNWYQAKAFCRWLQMASPAEIGWEIDLPLEWEWQHAALGKHEAEGFRYPWGGEYREGYANVDEIGNIVGKNYLRRTTAVGLYPWSVARHAGQTIDDLSGNVWEWCANAFEPGVTSRCALRGGSWGLRPAFAAAPLRLGNRPVARGDHRGFRVFCFPPSAAERRARCT